MAGCSESVFDASRTPSLFKRYLSVSSESLSFGPEASTKSLDLESDDTPWQVTIPADWVSADVKSGNSSAKLNFSAKPNNSADTSRVSIVQVSSVVGDWNRTFPITITQSKALPYIRLSQNDVVFSAPQQTLSVNVESNTEFEATSTAAWLHVSASANTLVLQVDENGMDSERMGIVTLKSKVYSGTSTSISVRQKVANIASTKEAINFDHNASSQSIVIDSEAAWTATASSWVGVSPSFGNAGQSTVRVEVPKNASASSRSGSVYFAISGKNRIEVPILQDGITLYVSKEDLAYDSFGGADQFRVESNDEWEVLSSPDWLTLSDVKGKGDATIQTNVEENNSTKAKEGNIVISSIGGLITRTIHVSVAAKKVEYGDASLSFGYATSTQSVSFATDARWSLSTDADWINVDKISGTGGAILNITVEENMTTEDRNGRIDLIIADRQFVITVHQECKFLTISSEAFEFDAPAGHANISVTSNTNWTATVKGNPNWLIVTPKSGTGNADITIGVSENNTANERTGIVEVDIPSVRTYLIEIKQARKYLKANMSSVDFNSEGGTILLNVMTDGSFDVSKTGNWFGYTRDENTLSVIAPKNNTGVRREGEIVLSLTGLSTGNVSIKIPVRQD